MKLFNFLTISAISAKQNREQNKDGPFPESAETRSSEYDCGGVTEFTKELTKVEISSPVNRDDPTKYPANTFCEWVLKDDCADSFTIKTIKFDIEGRCLNKK